MADERLRHFIGLVRAIDRESKAGKFLRALELLPKLLAMERGNPRFSKKKSHFIAALAYRAYQAGQTGIALGFLDLADREIPDDHLIPMLRKERDNIRKAAEGAEVRPEYHESEMGDTG